MHTEASKVTKANEQAIETQESWMSERNIFVFPLDGGGYKCGVRPWSYWKISGIGMCEVKFSKNLKVM